MIHVLIINWYYCKFRIIFLHDYTGLPIVRIFLILFIQCWEQFNRFNRVLRGIFLHTIYSNTNSFSFFYHFFVFDYRLRFFNRWQLQIFLVPLHYQVFTTLTLISNTIRRFSLSFFSFFQVRIDLNLIYLWHYLLLSDIKSYLK